MEQMTELLKAMLSKMGAMNANLDMRNTELDAHHERMIACLGKTRGHGFGGKSKGIVVLRWCIRRTLRNMLKWHRGWHLAAECRQEPKDRTQGNCGPQKKLTTTIRTMTHHAGVAWRKGNFVGKHRTRDSVVQGTVKRWIFGRRHQPKQECKNGIRNRGLRQQL
jgi:hypothetical protein